MTTNPNNTTAACSGSELADSLQSGELTLVWCHPGGVGAADATASQIALVETALRTQASAPRSASAGEVKPYTWAYQYHDCIRLNRGQEVNGARPTGPIPLYDQATIDRLSAPPTIRIDQDAGIRALKIEHLTDENARLSERVKTVISERLNVEFAFAMDAKRQIEKENSELRAQLAAISANTTAGREALEEARVDFLNMPYQRSVGSLYAHRDQAVAKIDAALASNPLEGKGIQSRTEQASSGVRSPTSGEG